MSAFVYINNGSADNDGTGLGLRDAFDLVNYNFSIASTIAGQTGPAGAIGPQGPIGPRGLKGDKGDKGDTGVQGETGNNGQTGPRGLKGDTGIAGPTGVKGDTGLRGFKGDKGDQGIDGAYAGIGAQGPIGPKGATGSGIQGVQGLQGIQGEKGDTGLQGEVGATGSFTAGNTLELRGGTIDKEDFTGIKLSYEVVFTAPMADFIVVINSIDPRDWTITNQTSLGFIVNSNSSTELEYDIDWQAIQKIDTVIGAIAGPQGIPGEYAGIGLTGETGPAGPIGPQGVQGLQGIQGVQGETGIGGIVDSDITVQLSAGRTLGKYSSGQTIPCAGWTFDQLIRDIAIEYLLPSFTTFEIDGQSTTIEVGTEIVGSKDFKFTTSNTSNIMPTLEIIDVTNSNNVILATSSITSPKSITLGSIIKNTPSANVWKIVSKNTAGASFERTFTVNWGVRRFAGSMASVPVDGASIRTALLGTSVINTTNSFTFQTGNVNKTFVIGIINSKTLVKVLNTDTNDDLTSLFILSSINTIPSANGINIASKVYIATFASAYSSNNNIQVTLS